MKYTKNNGKQVIPFNFKNKKDEEEYIFICTELWGCVPVEVDWAQNTKVYINKKETLKT